MIIKKLKKAALFTDFHIGAKNNSLTHLQDCHDYIDWFINNIKKDKHNLYDLARFNVHQDSAEEVFFLMNGFHKKLRS